MGDTGLENLFSSLLACSHPYLQFSRALNVAQNGTTDGTTGGGVIGHRHLTPTRPPATPRLGLGERRGWPVPVGTGQDPGWCSGKVGPQTGSLHRPPAESIQRNSSLGRATAGTPTARLLSGMS